MAIYVLVHGGWSGAHGFRAVRRPLHAAGHDVFTPSLTGIGERAHLTSPQVNLTTHIRDVVNVILYEDLTDIVLLGFSYGGFVVTGALEHIARRVRHLVYLDAFVPDDGDTLLPHDGQNLKFGGIIEPHLPHAVPTAVPGFVSAGGDAVPFVPGCGGCTDARFCRGSSATG